MFYALSNGEYLLYTLRKKNQIIEQFHSKQKRIINSFSHAGIPVTDEEYRQNDIINMVGADIAKLQNAVK